MKLSSLKIYALKLLLFSSVLAYLALDLWLIRGPVWKALHPPAENAGNASSIEAEVYGEKISEQQLDRYEAEQNWLSGRPLDDHSKRSSARLRLVKETVLHLRIRYNDKNLPDRRKETEEELGKLESRADNSEIFEQWLKSQNYTRKAYADKIASRLRGLSLLERAVEPFCHVSDDEVSAYYEKVKSELIRPAMRPVRHIFLSTLHKDPEEVRQQADLLMNRLREGEDFAELAKQHSQDEQTASFGGDLGILQDDDRRLLPELPLFGQHAVPPNRPVLAASKWGWHILLAGPITPSRPLTKEESEKTIRTALQSARREIAVEAFFDAALNEGLKQKKIKFHVKP